MSAEAVSPTTVSTPPLTPRMTVCEYLEMERLSELRHEYVDGEVRAMAGELPKHNVIAGNVYRRFGNEFDNRECQAYFEGVRLRVTPTQYRYPDVMALCGDERFDDENPPSLLNPSVIVEVLSASTRVYDREEKFLEYRAIPELRHYVLIEQREMLVIHYARQSPTQWLLTEYNSPQDTLEFDSVSVALRLEEIYRKVAFEDAGGEK